MEYIDANETIHTRRQRHDDMNLQCDNIVMQWVLYPFHDNVVVMLTSSGYYYSCIDTVTKSSSW